METEPSEEEKERALLETPEAVVIGKGPVTRRIIGGLPSPPSLVRLRTKVRDRELVRKLSSVTRILDEYKKEFFIRQPFLMNVQESPVNVYS